MQSHFQSMSEKERLMAKTKVNTTVMVGTDDKVRSEARTMAMRGEEGSATTTCTERGRERRGRPFLPLYLKCWVRKKLCRVHLTKSTLLVTYRLNVGC